MNIILHRTCARISFLLAYFKRIVELCFRMQAIFHSILNSTLVKFELWSFHQQWVYLNKLNPERWIKSDIYNRATRATDQRTDWPSYSNCPVIGQSNLQFQFYQCQRQVVVQIQPHCILVTCFNVMITIFCFTLQADKIRWCKLSVTRGKIKQVSNRKVGEKVHSIWSTKFVPW